MSNLEFLVHQTLKRGPYKNTSHRQENKQNLRKRIISHYQGNASTSTLRRSLGVLLTRESNFPLRRVGNGKRMTFTHLGEQWLDDWMERNAYVCWVKHVSPWELEDELIATLSLPLNIKGNKDHEFADSLSQTQSNRLRKCLLLIRTTSKGGT